MKKNRHYWQSIWCGLKGIGKVFKDEHSFKCHTIIGIIFIIVNILLKASYTEF